MIAVGGALDGQRLDEPYDDRKVFVFPKPEPTRLFGKACLKTHVEHCVYHVELLRTPDHTFRFYRHESLTTTDAIGILIQGYRS